MGRDARQTGSLCPRLISDVLINVAVFNRTMLSQTRWRMSSIENLHDAEIAGLRHS
jgi:hypothetical protein